MINKNSSISTVISDVKEIIAELIEEFLDIPLCRRTISIETDQGETFELILQAEKPNKLKVHNKRKNDWLIPKVYKLNDEE
jgi:hypothetical protein